MSQTASDAVSVEDVRQLYRLILRREPEQGAAKGLEDSLGLVLARFLTSEEFRAANLGPLMTGHVPNTSLDSPPPDALRWAVERLPLNKTAKRRLEGAASFLQVYHAILSDSGIRKRLGKDARAFTPSLLSNMSGAAQLRGLIDPPLGRKLSGWATRLDAPGEPVRLEVWANGHFIGATVTGLYRNDAAIRLSSSGHEGFVFTLPDRISGRVHIIVRDAQTRFILADAEVDFIPSGSEAFSGLSEELVQLRRAIETLEQKIPVQLTKAGRELDAYGNYYEDWIRHANLIDDQAAPVFVILDAVGVTGAELEDAIDSLADQRLASFTVTVGLLRKDLVFLQDLLVRVRWRRDLSIEYVVVDDNPAWRSRIDVPPQFRVVQLMRANGVLHPDALGCMAAALVAQDSPVFVYCDEDEFEASDFRDWRPRRHANPQLKPDFDYDLLLQVPYVGLFVAYDREVWREAISGDWQPADHDLSQLEAARHLLQARLQDGACAHVPQVLYTRSPTTDSAPSGAAWREIVAKHLGERASVEPHDDILGATLPSLSKIRWHVPVEATAAVIIPTKNRVDLLKPCIDSILTSLAFNKTRTRIHIVDHESSEAGTLEYLKTVKLLTNVDVQAFSGSFNWALMNNIAAHTVQDDVLIFLNNDTVVISPDWIDELAALAMRDDVGVVGCRLLYEDGCIQHAGFLALDDRRHFLTHEGLGEDGGSPGYLGRNSLIHRTIAVTGACMAVRRDVFRRLGGFDAARFHVEGNDVDLCFKAMAAGLKVLYSPAATLYHLESRTRGEDSNEDGHASIEASQRLWARWGDRVCPDPWYNRRFDRRARSFSRLVPV